MSKAEIPERFWLDTEAFNLMLDNENYDDLYEYSQMITKKEREKIADFVEASFNIYLAVFPSPRDDEQKQMQDIIKNNIRQLKASILDGIKELKTI